MPIFLLEKTTDYKPSRTGLMYNSWKHIRTLSVKQFELGLFGRDRFLSQDENSI
jgi:hypothetical protein